MRIMKAVELIGEVDAEHRLQAKGPDTLPQGPVRIIVLIKQEQPGSKGSGENGLLNSTTRVKIFIPYKTDSL